jgi:RNA polymerase sigma-70 factor (ECF subfamily)
MKDAPVGKVSLIARALDGEREAERQLAADLTPTVRASVLRTLRHAGRHGLVRRDVDDLTQSVWLVLWADGGHILRRWDPARGLALRAFVALLSRRMTISVLRSPRRSPYTEGPTDPETMDLGPALVTGPEAAAVASDLLVTSIRAMQRRRREAWARDR